MKTHKITSTGRAEIRSFLESNTKPAVTEDRITIWANELASAMDEGRSEIEVAARYTNSGHPEFLSVSAAGFAAEEITED